MARLNSRLRAMRSDEGFSMAEAIVAALVLVLFSSAVAGLLVTSMRASKVNRERVAASSLAAREMEIVRDHFQHIDKVAGNSNSSAKAIVDAGLVTNPDALASGVNVVDGVSYTIERSAFWEPKGTGVSACDGGSQVNYPSVHVYVTVTWPAMGSVKPVETDSVLTPNKTLLNSTYSFAAVKVLDFAGKANQNRTVYASGPAGSLQEITDDSGCAVFGLSTSGAYTLSLHEPGYVDFAGSPTPSKPLTVIAGSFGSLQFTYDIAGEIDVTMIAQSGYALPTTRPDVVLGNQSLPSPGTLTFATTSATTAITNLGPYSNGYTIWGGSCSDANPSGPPTSGSLSPVVLTPGGKLAANAVLGAVDVRTTRPGVIITATKSGGATCPAGKSVLTLGLTDGSGNLATSLPYGTWTLSMSSGGGTASFHPTPSGPVTVVIP